MKTMNGVTRTMFCCFLLLFCFKADSLILLPTDPLRALTSCINNLLELVTEGGVVSAVNFGGYLKGPVVRNYTWSRATTIVVAHLEQHLLMNVLERIDYRSSLIVVTKRVEKKIFEAALECHISKLLVVEDDRLTQKVYTFHPYQHEDAHTPSAEYHRWGICTNGSLTKSEEVLFDMPKQWSRTTIRALNNILPPYSICPNCSTNPGIEIEAFSVVAKHLQLEVIYTKSEFEYWGSKTNGSYSYLLGELQRREGDMCIGVFHSKFDEHLDFDMTFSYMEDSTRWLVPKARTLPYWKRLTLIFTKEVYLALLLSSIVMSVVARLLYTTSYTTSWMMLYQILLELGLERLPLTSRSVITTWILSCLVLSTMFKSKLIETMSKDSYEPQISTLADIVASKLHIMIDHDIAKFYHGSSSPDEDYIRTHYEYCIYPRLCINRTAFVQNCVTVDFERSHRFFFTDFVDADGNVLVYLFKIPIFPVHIHLFFAKAFPVFPQIDRLLMMLRSCGVIQHLYDDASYKARLAMSKKSVFKAEVLSVEQMEVAFFVWGCGMLAAVLAFIVEWVLGR